MLRKPCCSPDSDRHKKVGSGPAPKHCRTISINCTRTVPHSPMWLILKKIHQKVTSIISSVSRLYFLTSTSSPVLIIISRTRSMAATWSKTWLCNQWQLFKTQGQGDQKQHCGSGSETFRRIRIRKKSFRIGAAPDTKWIWCKTTLKTDKIWRFFYKNAKNA